jgi:hypothetical protein
MPDRRDRRGQPGWVPIDGGEGVGGVRPGLNNDPLLAGPPRSPNRQPGVGNGDIRPGSEAGDDGGLAAGRIPLRCLA